MDLATVLGLISGIVLLSTAILIGTSPMVFVSLGSLLIVAGGTIAATLIRFPGSEVKNALQVAKHAFTSRVANHQELIQQFVELSQISRKEGLLALESLEFADKFMAKGIAYCVDGAETHTIEAMLMREVRYTNSRHKLGIRLFKAMGESSPAFGMIGTLIGLVQMLTAMDDPNSIGPAMAIALLTTLYGALFANLICLPIAGKLELRNDDEQSVRMMVLEGVLGLRRGENPHLLQETLDAFVAPSKRVESTEEM